MRLPKAKTENIVVQDLTNELLIYNLATHKAYTLNETLKLVFESCDGAASFDELKRRHKFTDDLVHLALAELSANDLLIDYQSDHFKGLSRREVIKKVGLASVIALPVIAAITAPQAVHAASSSCTVRDPNSDMLGKGDLCACGQSSTNNSNVPLCNTTRGVDANDGGPGCKSGCLCQADTTQPCGGNGVCVGTCG